MTGFYSKDLILESAYGQFHFSSTVVYIIATIGAMFTTLYSVKVLYLTFLTNPNGPLINYSAVLPEGVTITPPVKYETVNMGGIVVDIPVFSNYFSNKNYKQAHEGDIFMSLPAGWCGKSPVWVKLSNSGEILKLMIPSHI